jgi:GNAT superfamily N-acetyltransferase
MRTKQGKSREARVRTAQLEDAASIAVLSGQLGYPCSAASLGRRLRSLLSKPDHAIWVAENKGGGVAGWIHVFVHQVLESDRQAEIGGLVIDENFRGQGAGKALVERAERWAKARRLNSVYVRSNIIRKEAHVFYQKQGYKIIKTQHAFRKDLC